MEQGADEGRPRERVSGASMNAADTPRVRRAGVASLSRAELERVAMRRAKGVVSLRFLANRGGRPLHGAAFAEFKLTARGGRVSKLLSFAPRGRSHGTEVLKGPLYRTIRG